MDLGGEPTTVTLLNKQHPKVHSKISVLRTTTNCTPHPTSRKFFLQQKDTIIESHNQCKCTVMQPSSSWYIYNITRVPKTLLSQGMREQKDHRAWGSGSLQWGCLPVRTEPAPRKSHQHDCLHRATTVDMLMWTGEDPQGFNPTQRTTGNYTAQAQEK